MEDWRIVSFVLLTVITVVRGQVCEAESFPPRYVPADDTSILQSQIGVLYVYTNVFSSTRCAGTVATPQYSFCYGRGQFTSGREVFTVLLLSNGASSYTVLDSYTEREDKSCARLTTCCKTVDRAVEVTVQRDLALGFVIPRDTGSNFLYARITDFSQAYLVSTAGLQFGTNVGGTIRKSIFGVPISLIHSRRFSVTFGPAVAITTTGSEVTTTETTTPPVTVMTTTENVPVDTTNNEGDTTTTTTGSDMATTETSTPPITVTVMATTEGNVTDPVEGTTNNGGDDNMTTTQGSGTVETSSTTTTTAIIITIEGNGPVARVSNGGSAAAGVIVALVLVGTATAIVVVLVVLLLRREKRNKQVPPPTHLGALDNHTYETQVEIGTINGNPASYFINHSLNDYADVVECKIDGSSCYEDISGGKHYASPISAKTDPGSKQEFGHKLSLHSATPRSRGGTHPLPPVPGVESYGDHIGSFSSQGMEGNTMIGMTLVSQGRTVEPIYQNPAEDEAALYEQYKRLNVTHIQKEHLSTTDVLGSGQFGVVYRGEWSKPGEEKGVPVAVKTLKAGKDREQKVKFLQEAAIIGQFSHPNVVKLHGIVIGEEKMIVLELLQGGDLRQALFELNRSGEGAKVDADLPHTLLSYCRQVASGMAYLSQKGFVHRDLAARNILLSEDGECKITDFGMSRDLANTNYYVSHGGKVPVKWTAPEAIHFHTYSTASDVWSFGCVMYEIWSLGNKPFGSYSNSDCIRLIGEGSRLPPPPGCPKTIYTLMIDCWHPEPASRPGFVSIVQQLSLPDTKILKWSEEDKAAVHPEASILGAGLDKSVDLYKDLQEKYTTK